MSLKKLPHGVKKTLSSRLTAERKNKGITAVFIAKKAKMSVQSVASIDTCKGSFGLGTLEKYAKALGLKIIVTYQIVSDDGGNNTDNQ